MHERQHKQINCVTSLSEFKGKAPTKMLFIDTTEGIAKLEIELRTLLGQRAHITRSDPEYLEYGPTAALSGCEDLTLYRVLNPQTNKGEGVARACEALGIPLAEVVAFGDADVRALCAYYGGHLPSLSVTE